MVKKTLTVEQYIKELILTLMGRKNYVINYPRTNKTFKILDMSLRLKKVCPVYKTYPITELKMHWLIH